MKKNMKNVRVMVKDSEIIVSYDWGDWNVVESSDAVLSILAAVCYPESHELLVLDLRNHRQTFKKKLSTDYPEDWSGEK